MSDSSDDRQDGGNVDDQPGGRDQPEPRSSGGRPQNEQPAGPQAGGQAGGRQPSGPQAGGQYQTEPDIGDVFNREETTEEIKIGVAIFAVIGVGLGLGVLLTGATAGNSSITDPAYTIAVLTLTSAFALPPVVGGAVGLRQAREIADMPQKLRLATAAVTGAGGGFLMLFLTYLLGVLGLDTSGQFATDFGDAFLPMIFVAVGTAVAAAGVVFVIDRLPGSEF